VAVVVRDALGGVDREIRSPDRIAENRELALGGQPTRLHGGSIER
jgi:hypothetical protein